MRSSYSNPHYDAISNKLQCKLGRGACGVSCDVNSGVNQLLGNVNCDVHCDVHSDLN